MSPIDTIINMFDNCAASYQKQADSWTPSNEDGKDMKLYTNGKAAGLREAADHLRNLQKLFN